jgi:uncharacterized protein (UPF0333 family)
MSDQRKLLFLGILLAALLTAAYFAYNVSDYGTSVRDVVNFGDAQSGSSSASRVEGDGLYHVTTKKAAR